MTITGSNTTNFGFQKLGSNDSAGYSTINEVVDGIDTILNASDRLIKAAQTPTVAYIITGDGTDWVRGLVVTASITDLNVTTGKLAELAVTTGKIAANAVTLGAKTSGDYVATVAGTASQIASSAASSGVGTTHTLSLVSGATLPGAPTVATAVGSYPQSSTTSRVSTVQYVNDAVANVNSSGSVALSGDIGGTAGATVINAGVIVDADVNATAAIAYSKLNLASSITSADIVNNTIVLGDLATALQAFLTPTGALMPFAGLAASAPAGWLVCDGRSYAASGASAGLQTILNAAGFTTLPDLAVKTIMAPSVSYALASTGGGSTTLSGTQLPAHSHTIDHGHSTGSSQGGFQGIGNAPGGYQLGNGDGWNQGAMAGPLTVTAHSGSSGNGPGTSASVPTVPPYLILNYIIKN